MESSLGYHPDIIGVLTKGHETGRRTLLGGQFDWGVALLKCNGGAQTFPQRGTFGQIGRAHVWTSVTPISRMASSVWKNELALARPPVLFRRTGADRTRTLL